MPAYIGRITAMGLGVFLELLHPQASEAGIIHMPGLHKTVTILGQQLTPQKTPEFGKRLFDYLAVLFNQGMTVTVLPIPTATGQQMTHNIAGAQNQILAA